MKNKHLLKKPICKNCGHNHVFVVGDLGPNQDEEGYEFIESHDTCHKYEANKARKVEK